MHHILGGWKELLKGWLTGQEPSLLLQRTELWSSAHDHLQLWEALRQSIGKCPHSHSHTHIMKRHTKPLKDIERSKRNRIQRIIQASNRIPEESEKTLVLITVPTLISRIT